MVSEIAKEMSVIPCGDNWMDCPYYDPGVCDLGECVLVDAMLWGNYYDTEYNYVYADMVPDNE